MTAGRVRGWTEGVSEFKLPACACTIPQAALHGGHSRRRVPDGGKRGETSSSFEVCYSLQPAEDINSSRLCCGTQCGSRDSSSPPHTRYGTAAL